MNGTRQRMAPRLAIGASVILAAGLGRTAEAPKPCCFTNERFAGVCEVVPADDESCDGILSYLNTPNSTGKTYCGTTAVRGGWRRAACSGPGDGSAASAATAAPNALRRARDDGPPRRPR